jgi:hypothetical protein
MQECGTSTGKSSFVKRVTVRSGGAGHAHSGIVKVTGVRSEKKGDHALKGSNGQIVRLGR